MKGDALVLSQVETGQLDVERAAAWLAKCVSVDAVKDVRDKARAIEVYQRTRNASLDAQQDAAEIAIRAERRLGEMCRDTVKRGNPKLNGAPGEPLGTLGEMGITRKQSSRWQKLATIEAPDFEAHIRLVRDKGEKLTTAGTIRATSDAEGYDGDEWYTPSKYIEAAREVLGEIDLDPCSSIIAQRTVRARSFYTKEDNALKKGWLGRVWLNPPYSQPLIGELTQKFIDRRDVDLVTAGIVLVNNATDTAWCQALLKRYAACFTSGRIAFQRADGKAVSGARQGQVFFYTGPEEHRFVQVFERFGSIVIPAGAA